MQRGHFRPPIHRWIELAGVASMVASGACETRDRLRFPSTGPAGIGPHTVIDRPSATTVTVSSDSGNYLVTGYSVDADGLDSLYFETSGGLTSFQPEVTTQDSFRFGLPVTTLGLAGDSILLRVFATDQLGNRGDTAIRLIVVQ